MKQDTRVLIAFALSFVMLVVWRVMFVKEPPPKPQPAPTAQGAQKPDQPPASVAKAAAAPAKPAAPVALPVEQGSEAREIVVESDLYRVTFSTEGAVVKSWVLKKYKDEQGNLLNVIHSAACEKLGYPMSVRLTSAPDPALSDQINKALFVSKRAESALRAPTQVEFVFSDGNVRVKKEFNFSKGYEVQVEVSVWNGEHYLPAAVQWPGGFGDQSVPPQLAALTERGVYQAPGGEMVVESLTPSWHSQLWASLRGASPPKPQGDIAGPLLLAGLEDRYFAGIFLPDSANANFEITRLPWTPPDWMEKSPLQLLAAKLSSPGGQPLKFRLFVAPKDLDVLRAENPPLEGLVDFGWFKIFAEPLFLGMRYIYEHWAHNYGWAIAILTVLINMAMFPLKLKQIRSAQEMQKVAPIVKGIQERYKQYKLNDPRKQRMNQEVMKIYKEHGINPLGGCLPMVLQLPILYGFYRVLDLPIELRHAPWIGWVKDLSVPETVHLFGYGVHVLPIVMVASMLITQKMTPMPTADPAQQRMMMLMPLFFAVMFYNLASGLVLYFLIANLVGIAQQVYINKTKTAAVAAPAARKTSEPIA